MPFRYTMILQLTTSPTDPEIASAHIGGWSESHWRNDQIDPSVGEFRTLMSKRAALLPVSAAVVGYRVGAFTIRGNKLYPGPTSAGRIRFPGIYPDGDIPQMALSLGASSNSANSARFNIAGIPDSQVVGGEWSPDTGFKRNLTAFRNALVSGDWGFIGRDLTQASARMMGVSAGVVTTDGSTVLIPGVDWLRFHKVKDSNGKPITGAYMIASSPSANKYLLTGLDAQISAGPNGSVRRDLVQQYSYTAVNPGRIKVRKIGRPSEQYRGRRSKRAAA